MAYTLSLFKPVQASLTSHNQRSVAYNVERSPTSLTCIPIQAYTALLAVNACIFPLLLSLKCDTCRSSMIKTFAVYLLMFYNFIIATVLTSSNNTTLGTPILVFIVVVSIIWLMDRIRFCLMLKTLLPLVDMRSHFIRVSTCTSYTVVAVSQSRPYFIKNFEQTCTCPKCCFIHSINFLECTFYSRFNKVSLVSAAEFSVADNISTVYAPQSRGAVPLHIIAPSVLTDSF
nr:orf5 protein [Betacoronavirus Erinaceus]